jgi:hypothetical protein
VCSAPARHRCEPLVETLASALVVFGSGCDDVCGEAALSDGRGAAVNGDRHTGDVAREVAREENGDR